MKQLLLVFLGGGFGSVMRFLLSTLLNPWFRNFYLGTFLSNILGCLLIGLILGVSMRGQFLSENQTLLLAVGFCGGFTTFSAFAFEGYSLLKTGAWVAVILYYLSSIVVGLAALGFGLWLSK